MKTKANSLLTQLQPRRVASALIILAIAFIFAIQWGPGSRGCEAPMGASPDSAAALVNGKEIPVREFQRAYANTADYYRQQAAQQGREFSESEIRQELSKAVLGDLVMRELLQQEAEREGIWASDAELARTIKNNPDFQVEGKFDEARYREVVNNYYRRTVPEYENALRREVAGRRLLEVVRHSALVSEDEVKARYMKDADNANLTYVRFLPRMFEGQVHAPSAHEIDTFKKQQAAQIESYYKSHPMLYQTPERVRARHILVAVDKNASPEKKAEAKQKIEKLRGEIQHGKDFAQVARESSDDPGSKSKGGELGWNEKGSWVPQFQVVAFALKPGELSQPVETPFGFHLIQVEEKQPAQKKALKDVENDIAKKLLVQNKAQAIAKAEAAKALKAAQSGKDLRTLYPPKKSDEESSAFRFEVESKPEALSTNEFSIQSGSIPYLGAAPELLKDVTESQGPRVLDKVYPVGDGFVVATLASRHKPSEADFVAQKEKRMNDALQTKQGELQQEFLVNLRKSGKVKENEGLLRRGERG